MLIEKFDSEKHLDLISDFPFSYFSLPVYLDCVGYILNRNGEKIVVSQDIYNFHEFPAVFLPKKKKNWRSCSVTFVTDDDLKRIKDEGVELLVENKSSIEFFYLTEDFINPKKKSFKERVKQFQRLYEYEIFHEYPKEKIIDFYKRWKSQKDRSSAKTFDESEAFFLWLLDNLEKYNVKQVYVEVSGELIGLAFGVEYDGDRWAGLQLKVDYGYKGLSRFMHYERAKLFRDKKYFTIGSGAHEKGIERFKRELGPIKEVQYYYILICDKII